MNATDQKILVLGASGYIGGRLIPCLINRGYAVRAVSRNADKLKSRPWAGHARLELFSADVMDRESLRKACEGCHAAYYLVHSMEPQSKDFADADRRAADNMIHCARDAGLSRIIYLGGLGEPGPELSRHLRSRIEVGDILQSGDVPTTTLRAAMIMGSGSASFEILCYLVRRLPIMVTPRWVRTESQPIAIRNVVVYLLDCLKKEETLGQVFDIGGPEIVSYEHLMRMYAKEAGLPRRIVFPVPVLTPRLSSYWIHLVTPIPSSLAQPLAEGLKNRVVCRDSRICDIITQDLISPREAIRLALQKDYRDHKNLVGPDSESPPPEWVYPGDAKWAGGAIVQ